MNGSESPGARRSAPEKAPLDRREQKKRATRTAVIEAGVRLVARHGVDNVTIDQIAAEADIAQRTFFNHFRTKEEALVASTSDTSREMLAAFRERPPAESVLMALRNALFTVFDGTKATDPIRAQALRAIRTSPTLKPYQLALSEREEQDLADAIRERATGGGALEIDPLYPTLCASAAVAVMRVVLTRWLTASAATDAPPLSRLTREFEHAFNLLTDGMDHPSGLSGADPTRERSP